MIDPRQVLDIEFDYLEDIDPTSGAPIITAVPRTVAAAKQGIPYEAFENFGDLFQREHLREAWRLMRKNDPFDYQMEIADAILFSALQGLGWYFVIMVTRQAGKNEISAFLQQYILLYGWYFGKPVSGVKFAPVYKPQVQSSMDRLEGADTADSGGLAGSILTKSHFRKSDGYKFHMGTPRDTNKWAFLSINPSASVASQTAMTLLEGDEAQDIDVNKWERDAQPMGSFNNATTVLWGVAWTKQSFIYQGMQQALLMEERLEAQIGYRPKLVYKVDAYKVIAAGNDNYRKAFQNQLARLGIDHIAIQTQYLLNFIDSIGVFFSEEQKARIYGNDYRMRVGPRPGSVYIWSLDIAGQEEAPTTTDDIEVGKHKRDGMALTIGELQRDGTTVVACLYQWVGQAHTKMRELLPKIIRHWGCIGGSADGTGIGEPLAYYLQEVLTNQVVEVYKFKAQGDENKSKLGYLVYDVINNDLLKIPHRPVDDLQQAELWDELKYQVDTLIREAKKQQAINWYVPSNSTPRKPGHVPHDDLATSLFLLVRAAHMIKDPKARQAKAFDRSEAGI